jgi:glycosyltransferase involved in cell wall biosynthesis
MNNKNVSVLIRAHLNSPYIEQTLDSVNNQDTKIIDEIVIVLDRPDQNLIRRLDNYSSKIIIRTFQIYNSNIANSMNIGIKNCSNEFIAVIDSDDLMLPSRIRMQYLHMQLNTKCGVIGSDALMINEYGIQIGEIKMPKDDSILKKIKYESPIIHPSAMLRKSAVLDVCGYREFYKNAEDFDLFKRISIKYELNNLSLPLIAYRIHDRQLTKSKLYDHVWAKYAAIHSTSVEANITCFGKQFNNINQFKCYVKKRPIKMKGFLVLYLLSTKSKNYQLGNSYFRAFLETILFLLTPIVRFKKLFIKLFWKSD